MISYAARAVAARLRAAPGLFALAVLGVALGVGAVLSIQLLNANALAAFRGTVRAVSGDAALSIVPVAASLDEALLGKVLPQRGVAAAQPLVRVEVALADRAAGGLDVLGVDLLSPRAGPSALSGVDLAEALGTPGWIAVSRRGAERMGWSVGSRVAASAGSRRVELVVGAIADFDRVAPGASARLALMDIAQAQALLGERGRLQQIDVRAADGTDVADLAHRLSDAIGPAARVVTPEQRQSEAEGLLSAFRLNLTALSAVSLLVGGFLVHATMQAALVRRREELGVLRCLGATRGQVLGVILADAALLGLAGTALGIPLGTWAARASVGAVSGTLRNLYLLEGIDEVRTSPGMIALAVAVGLAGAIAGALLPALDVARRDPRALLASLTLEEPAAARRVRHAAAALAIPAAVAALILGLAPEWKPGGFVVALSILAAVPLAAPALVAASAWGPRPRTLSVAYGARTLRAHLRATALAAGALGVAAAMLAAITVMVGSFRATVEDWLGSTLRADVYVTTLSWRRGRGEAGLDDEIVRRLAARPEVRRVDRLRQVPARSRGQRITVSGFDSGVAAEQGGRVQLVSGERASALREVAREGAALVSEPLARKRGLRVGDRLPVDTPAGEALLPIAGVYADYGSESGAALVDLDRTLPRLFGRGPVTNVALELAPGADVDAAVDRLRRELSGEALLIRSNRALRADVMAIFDQTFAVTRLLQLMTLLIAVAGVLLALLVLARERQAEIALYRALGAERGQIFRLFLGRALGIAGCGLVLGAAGGAGLALVLVRIVNPAWFGWTLALHWPWAALASEAIVLLAAAALASIYPAARASAAPATELSRDAL
ncbi:MAG TPA: FtsX-like permease family protein [Anaeromyxobacteraceae bacterium]|nr:FtsX-like permease family protein [Anaeromyxobacteraceae bacterium]